MMQKKFFLDIKSLDEIFDFIESFVRATKIEARVHYLLNLVIEELVTNMIKYNRKEGGEVEITLENKESVIHLTLTDFDVPPFDITQVAAYDTRQSLEKRPIGKVGIHLIREMMDSFEYRHEHNNSIITLTKRINT